MAYKVTMTGAQLEESVNDGVWHFDCPSCEELVAAEPDAECVVCQECDVEVAINNPFF